MKIIFLRIVIMKIFFKTHLDALQTEPVRVKAFWVWKGFWVPVTVFLVSFHLRFPDHVHLQKTNCIFKPVQNVLEEDDIGPGRQDFPINLE